MSFEKIGFIGLGLIGGSIAKTLKRLYPDVKLYATSGHLSTVTAAYAEHTIENNELLDMETIAGCDLIFLCTPVQKNIEYLRALKPFIQPGTIITDVGSTKSDIHAAVIEEDMEQYFIGGHPMTGSEQTGFSSASEYLLENAYYILTPTKSVPTNKVEDLTALVKSMDAITLVLDYKLHDYATATISHVPHIIAYNLVNLVKQLDDENETMKTIAAGGFKDITRIASSSPVMWENICLSNSEQILKVLDLYIQSLEKTRQKIVEKKGGDLLDYFQSAKDYRDSFSIQKSGLIKQIYEVYVDLIDEAGGIATIATLLASNNISIKNIGIIHNREYENGVLRLELYDNDGLEKSIRLLKKHHYVIYER
ncbi:MAG: prephenate dehydrogenase/arogenate dehydrogenase family protein [Lachnospiraceae bacterium]|nr:prephenate dehydrogenase/arogenate dehydrogenase family protein [Lachnospiraceae bacterium]